MELPEIIRRRRTELGMSQAQLAAAAGVDQRQIRRYEAGEQQPLFSVAVAIADALEMSVAQLAGKTTNELDLAGTWWSAWQTTRDGRSLIAVQPVEVVQRRTLLELNAERSMSVEEGGYRWQGELRLWDNEVLMGWYRSIDAAVRSKGTMYFALHPHGNYAWGRWVGLSYDGLVVTGWGSLARTRDQADQVVQSLVDSKADDDRAISLHRPDKTKAGGSNADE